MRHQKKPAQRQRPRRPWRYAWPPRAPAQSDGPRRLLSPYRAAARRRCRRLCHRAQAGATHLRLLRWGQPYLDDGAAAYEKRYHEARVNRIAASAKQLGYTLVSVTT